MVVVVSVSPTKKIHRDTFYFIFKTVLLILERKGETKKHRCERETSTNFSEVHTLTRIGQQSTKPARARSTFKLILTLQSGCYAIMRSNLFWSLSLSWVHISIIMTYFCFLLCTNSYSSGTIPLVLRFWLRLKISGGYMLCHVFSFTYYNIELMSKWPVLSQQFQYQNDLPYLLTFLLWIVIQDEDKIINYESHIT